MFATEVISELLNHLNVSEPPAKLRCELGSDTQDGQVLYEMRETPSKGYGLFARSLIPRGTRVISEPPLVTINKLGRSQLIWSAVERLDSVGRAQYHALHGDSSSETVRRKATEALNARRPELSPGSEQWQKQLALDVAVIAIIEANGFSIDEDTYGIFRMAARVNHSCLPNLHYHYNCTLGHLTMHTVRDIAEGEELTDGYIWTTCMTRSEREEALDHWGFKCTCTPCTGPETANSNIRRKRLGVLRQSLLAFEDGNNQNREGHEGDHLESRRPEQTAKIAEEVVRLLLEEGVADTSLQDAYRDCAIYHRQLGDKDNTLKWATKELEVEQYCLGTDDMYYFNESGLSAQAWFDGVDRRQDHTRVAKANLAKREERRRIKELRRADKKAWREVMLVERLEQFEGSEAL